MYAVNVDFRVWMFALMRGRELKFFAEGKLADDCTGSPSCEGGS